MQTLQTEQQSRNYVEEKKNSGTTKEYRIVLSSNMKCSALKWEDVAGLF